MNEYQELIERLEFEFDHEAAEAIRTLITRAETAEKRLAECEQGVRSAIKRTAELLFDAFDITVAAEREACAKIAETVAAQGLHASMWAAKFKAVAAAIRARGSAEAQKGDDGWLPIESAPENKAIHVFIPGTDYYGNQGIWIAAFDTKGMNSHWRVCGWAGIVPIKSKKPTHWRPLPPAPQADGEGV